MTTEPSTWRGPLDGLKVLDLTRVLAGPFCTQMLSDLGAEIWKVEQPGHGDDTRLFPPHIQGESHYFVAINRGKKSLVVDIQTDEGKALIKDLAAKVDVVIENFRVGVMDRLGLGYDALSAVNPQLIYCAVSGFGMTGPLRDTPSFDIVTQALTGALSVNGEAGRAPVKIGLPMGDMVGGIFGSVGVLSAVIERQRTGRGRLVDISLYDGLIGLLGYFAQLAFVTGENPAPVGSGHPNIVPYNQFPARDGSLILACLTPRFWENVCGALGRPDLAADPRFHDIGNRRTNRDELERIISDVTQTRSVAEWQEVLTAADVPHAPVLGVAQALAQPHAVAREMVVEVHHATAGTIRMTGRPVKFPGAPQVPLEPPPVLGQHTAEILSAELGLSDGAIERLRASGVIDRRQPGA